MKTNRITFTTLAVADVARARAYYEAIGWEVESDMGEAVFFAMTGAKLSLFTLEGLSKETGRPVESLGTGAMTLAQNFPDEAGVDAMFAHAVSCGATPVREPFKTDWGGYSSYVADPDGHLWEFAHNPFSPLDDEGLIA